MGDGECGRLGDGTVDDSADATVVTGVMDALCVTTGSRHACVLHANRRVSCWGRNGSGALGTGSAIGPQDGGGTACSPVPVAVVAIDDAIDLSVGDEHACAALYFGQAACWGQNASGELGIGMAGLPVPLPQAVLRLP